MLSILLLLTVPQTAPAQPQATMRVIGDPPACADRVTRTIDPTSPGSGLMWREGGEAVGLYRLLERRVDGCPAPVIVNYRVPGSNAVGREMGRGPAQPPVVRRRP